jgi:hypothetical protein
MTNVELLNWECCRGCDVGGMMQKWLKQQFLNTPIPNTDNIRWNNKPFHTDSIYCIKHLWSGSWDLTELPSQLVDKQKLIDFMICDVRNTNGKIFCEIYDDVFLHYRAGGNWRGEGLNLHKHLSQLLQDSLL